MKLLIPKRLLQSYYRHEISVEWTLDVHISVGNGHGSPRCTLAVTGETIFFEVCNFEFARKTIMVVKIQWSVSCMPDISSGTGRLGCTLVLFITLAGCHQATCLDGLQSGQGANQADK